MRFAPTVENARRYVLPAVFSKHCFMKPYQYNGYSDQPVPTGPKESCRLRKRASFFIVPTAGQGLKKCRRAFLKGDLVIVLFILLCALALLIPSLFGKTDGGSEAFVYIDSVRTTVISLAQDGVYHLTDSVVAEVSGGELRILRSGCPDQLCVRSSPIGRAGEILVCLPNRVLIRVVSSANQEVDAIVQ